MILLLFLKYKACQVEDPKLHVGWKTFDYTGWNYPMQGGDKRIGKCQSGVSICVNGLLTAEASKTPHRGLHAITVSFVGLRPLNPCQDGPIGTLMQNGQQF